MVNNYLKILDLSIGATKTEIKAAYRKLSKKYHPDVNNSEDAKEHFIAINEAYRFLMDVGPRPNNENITYNYNPHDAAYEAWRQKAKAYAWKKAREAERHKQQQLSQLLQYFDFVAVIIMAFNFFLAVDYFLPEKTFQEKVIKVSKVYDRSNENDPFAIHQYDDISFQHFNMRVSKRDGFKIGHGDKAAVTATFLFRTPLYAVVTKGTEKIILEQAYSVYTAFGFIIPLMLLIGVFYKFLLRNIDHKLALAIVMIMLFPLQLFLFFKF